ncbi:MAG: hypothetical protein A2Z04_06255 [Chloroflexi bacterium RBG_16_57_9]|nr:MAG: hypothetical protein A2Z04_06255 [Chloroflexi bacterium RBG_16_57_9]
MRKSDPDPVLAWVNKAEEDYHVALALMRLRKRPVPASVCYHCQQCVEKYLKAFVVSHDEDFPKVHDLLALKDLCLRLDPLFPVDDTPLRLLTGYAIRIRYPGEHPTTEQTREAISAMKQVRRLLRKRLLPRELG